MQWPLPHLSPPHLRRSHSRVNVFAFSQKQNERCKSACSPSPGYRKRIRMEKQWGGECGCIEIVCWFSFHIRVLLLSFFFPVDLFICAARIVASVIFAAVFCFAFEHSVLTARQTINTFPIPSRALSRSILTFLGIEAGAYINPGATKHRESVDTYGNFKSILRMGR